MKEKGRRPQEEEWPTGSSGMGRVRWGRWEGQGKSPCLAAFTQFAISFHCLEEPLFLLLL